MDTPAIINQISLLRSHASEALKIADSLTKSLTTSVTSRKGLSDQQKAKLIAKKNRNRK